MRGVWGKEDLRAMAMAMRQGLVPMRAEALMALLLLILALAICWLELWLAAQHGCFKF